MFRENHPKRNYYTCGQIPGCVFMLRVQIDTVLQVFHETFCILRLANGTEQDQTARMGWSIWICTARKRPAIVILLSADHDTKHVFKTSITYQIHQCSCYKAQLSTSCLYLSRSTRKPTLWTLRKVSTRINLSMTHRLARTDIFASYGFSVSGIIPLCP